VYRESKPLLDTSEQITHLVCKGVKFDIVSLDDAKAYLDKNNNYFKIRAYRKNFAKHPEGELAGQYINLDFAMLKDLAIIDMRLRYILIHMALDIEHFSKVKLLKVIEKSGEDGYQIVVDYLESLRKKDSETDGHRYDTLVNELFRNTDSPYCGGIIRKYDGEYPVWAFIEIIPFGSFIHFYGFCADKLNCADIKDDFFLLTTVKSLRNAAAHSNCILFDMGAKDQQHKLNYNVARALPTELISKYRRDVRIENERMRQLVTLLYTHAVIVTSEGVRNHQRDSLYSLVERMFTNAEMYSGNDVIQTNFEFFMKVVDIFYP